VLLRGSGADLLLLAEVKALVERRLALEPDTADTYAFRAERAVAELRAAASVVKAQELCAEAMDLIEIALARFGTDVHVLVVAAQFFFNLPENLGGSRERAHAYLLAACDDARRGAAMRRLLAKKFPEAS
jgi:hypothetical protein